MGHALLVAHRCTMECGLDILIIIDMSYKHMWQHMTCLQITALISAAISQKACRFPSVFSTMSGYTLAGKFQWFSRCQKCRPTDKGCTPHSHMVLKVNQWKSQPLIQHVSLTSLLPHHVGLSRLTCTPEITLEIKGARKRLSFISSTQ